MALICALTVHSEYLDRYFHIGLRTVYKSIKLWKYPTLIRHKKVYSMRSSKRVQEHYPLGGLAVSKSISVTLQYKTGTGMERGAENDDSGFKQ